MYLRQLSVDKIKVLIKQKLQTCQPFKHGEIQYSLITLKPLRDDHSFSLDTTEQW